VRLVTIALDRTAEKKRRKKRKKEEKKRIIVPDMAYLV
jgi:hypothetical protein